jgi:hypothetical protein
MKRLPLITGTMLLLACSGITDPVCACSPPGGGTAVITGTVRSPAMAPVPGARVRVWLLQDNTCEEPARTVVSTVQTDAAGGFRHTESWSGGRKCFRVSAEPPQGSALAPSESQLVRVDFLDTGVTPDSVAVTLQLR